MKKRTLPLLLSMAIAPATFAAIQLNGETISDFTITHSNGNIFISTTGGTTTPEPQDPTPVDPTPVDPTPPPPIDTGSCGDGGATVIDTLNWGNQPGQTAVEIPRSGTVASKFTTTSSGTYNGNVTLGQQSGNGYVSHNLWISSCPGGAPVAQARNGCEDSGTEASVRWSQEDSPRSSYACKLQRNTTYYINYSNSGCNAATCDAWRNTYTN